MATIRDVAERAGVSVATVSAVLNQSCKVSEKLTARVLAATRELNYRPNRLARALSQKRTHLIGCLVPTIVNPFFPQVVKSVEDIAFENQFGIFVCNSEGNSGKVRYYQQMLLETQVDGVIIALSWELARPEVIQPFLEAGIPVVGLAGARRSELIDCVVVDDVQGGFDAANHLIELGHTRIGYIGAQNSETTRLRLLGYKKALQAAGLPYDERDIMLGNSFSDAEGYTLAKMLLAREPEISAIFSYNDIMGLGVMSALHDQGIAVPAQLSVIGFDDSAASYSFPKMSTMEIPKAEMGRIAANVLINRIGGQAAAPRVFELPPRLVVRDSTGPLHHE
ncbi:LacI family transcriptional regulator [Hydrogenispora ethanolica]|uniref:LacI family transcriptional regulator n=1 Tax=Hydrogenispora ethanolica TaxID=1082276 RepID=A0A4R1SBM4_HYDET|nr:LacI family DNA-binding transcriptional regulator [Hydrogenispora ethanolica]TCL76410.1 LacI family transcriptional regulator [Hydrogenispora ethanolica]